MFTKKQIIEWVGKYFALLFCDMELNVWYTTIGRFDEECELLQEKGFLEKGEKIDSGYQWRRIVSIIDSSKKHTWPS